MTLWDLTDGSEVINVYDLRFESWIPWRRRSGRVEWGPIRLLTDQYDTDPVVALAAPRPEFSGALTEFLIGMLTVTFQSDDETDWQRRWAQPPTPAEIEKGLRALPDAFRLGGEGPLFLQDHTVDDFDDVEVLAIERLLFNAPGEQAIERNKDLFVKRNGAMVLGQPAGAMALLAMQTYAPAGGKGYRTSMRGGGPLTTIVDTRDPHTGDQFWRFLWANVETTAQWETRNQGAGRTAWALVFPWLEQTRTSDGKHGGLSTTPADGHPLQAYFGMPRRIRLQLGGGGTCDLTGNPSAGTIVGFRTRNYGIDYHAWTHPLTPFYRNKSTAEWLPMHAQPNGVGWKDWSALVVGAGEGTTMPARTAGHFHLRGSSVGVRAARLYAFGVDFDNMKCRGWVEGRLPYLVVPDETDQRRLRDLSTRLTEATSLAAAMTRIYVKAALFEKPDEARGAFDTVTDFVWNATESTFYATLNQAVESVAPDEVERQAPAFHSVLRSSALAAFDHHCDAASAPPKVMRRTVLARSRLSGFLNGYGPKGAQLGRLLMLVVPARKSRATTGKRKGRETG